MIIPAIKEKILNIVSVFETGRPAADYGAMVVMADGPGGKLQITYGKHQSTEYSSLRGMLTMYVEAKGKFAEQLRPYLGKIGSRPLHGDAHFKRLLKEAAKEQKMQDVQDKFFEERYWQPAHRFFSSMGFTLPLSMLVIYDSYIQSGGILGKLRARFTEPVPINKGNEKRWISAYTATRDKFLERNPNKHVRSSDYRTDALMECIQGGNWDLGAPVVVKFNGSDPRKWVTVR